MVTSITALRLRDWIDQDRSFSLLDTRAKDSFESWHIKGAIQYSYNPDDDFDVADFQSQTGLTPDASIVTICAKGISSYDIAKKLADTGYEDLTVVEDGMEGWSTVYDTVDIPTTNDADIIQFQRRAKGCLGYLIGDPETNVAAVIDPNRHVSEYVSVASELGYSIEYVFDTHIHADHISGGRELADYVGATYYLSEGAAERNVTYDFRPLARNEVVLVGTLSIKALETPGHTSDIVSYLLDSEAVFTGDTLFVDSVGRTELQFGDGDAATGAELLYDSLHGTILAEPDTITILPGHFAIESDGTTAVTPGEPVLSTVGTVRTDLSVLQTDKASFVSRITDSLPEKPPNFESIIDINAGRDRPDSEEQSTELELGPNNCAAASD